jgi:hypothetical protein
MQPTTQPDDRRPERPGSARPAWQPPEIEVVALDCEISAYAPAEGELPS